MSTTWSGGCACGDLRYDIKGEPAAMLHCQCRQCQRSSGTGHQSYLTFVGAEARMRGEPGVWESVGDGGTVKLGGFCPRCGTPVYLQFRGMPDVVGVTAGSLDDPSGFVPQYVTWTSAGQAWDALEGTLTRFEKMPV